MKPDFGDRLGGVNDGRSPALVISGHGFFDSLEYKCVFRWRSNALIASKPCQHSESSDVDCAGSIEERDHNVSVAAEFQDIRTIICVPPSFDASTLSKSFQSFETRLSIQTGGLNPSILSYRNLTQNDTRFSFVHINKRPFFVAGTIKSSTTGEINVLNQGKSDSFDNWATQISPGIFEDDFRTFVSQEVD